MGLKGCEIELIQTYSLVLCSLPTDQDCHELWSKMRRRKLRQEQKTTQHGEQNDGKPGDQQRATKTDERTKAEAMEESNTSGSDKLQVTGKKGVSAPPAEVVGMVKTVEVGEPTKTVEDTATTTTATTATVSSVINAGQSIGLTTQVSQMSSGSTEKVKEETKDPIEKKPSITSLLAMDFDYGDSPEEEIVKEPEEKKEGQEEAGKKLEVVEGPESRFNEARGFIAGVEQPMSVTNVLSNNDIPATLQNQPLPMMPTTVDVKNPVLPVGGALGMPQHQQQLVTRGISGSSTEQQKPNIRAALPQANMPTSIEAAGDISTANTTNAQLLLLVQQLQQQQQQTKGAGAVEMQAQVLQLLTLLQTAQNQAQLNQVVKQQQDLTVKKLRDTMNMQLMLVNATKQIEEQKKKLEQAQLLQQLGALQQSIQQKQEVQFAHDKNQKQVEEQKKRLEQAQLLGALQVTLQQKQDASTLSQPTAAQGKPSEVQQQKEQQQEAQTKTSGVLLALNQLINQQGLKISGGRLSKATEQAVERGATVSPTAHTAAGLPVKDTDVRGSTGGASQGRRASGGRIASSSHSNEEDLTRQGTQGKPVTLAGLDLMLHPPGESAIKPPTETMSLGAKMKSFFASQDGDDTGGSHSLASSGKSIGKLETKAPSSQQRKAPLLSSHPQKHSGAKVPGTGTKPLLQPHRPALLPHPPAAAAAASMHPQRKQPLLPKPPSHGQMHGRGARGRKF